MSSVHAQPLEPASAADQPSSDAPFALIPLAVAINDYGAQHRVVRRVTISGTRALGADGRTSEAIAAA